MVQKQHVNAVVVAKVSPLMTLPVSSTVSFPYFGLSWRCLTFMKKVSREAHTASMNTGVYPKELLTSGSVLRVILVRLEMDFGPPCLLSFSHLERNHTYRVGLKYMSTSWRNKTAWAQMQSLQPEEQFLRFTYVRRFTSSKMLYSVHVLTEKIFVFSPLTHYGRDKTENIILFLSETPCELLYKVQRGKKKQWKGISLKYQDWNYLLPIV